MNQRRLSKMRKVGCLACRLTGHFNDQFEVHHLVDRGTRKASGGDKATIPLCFWHHRAGLPEYFSKQDANKEYGPSLANGSKPFEMRFGTQRELLTMFDEMPG